MPSPLAPTTTVSQLIATEVPKYATGAASEAVSLACSVHTPSQTSRTKTYAAPSEFWSSGSLEWNGAPTMAVSPEIPTEVPKSSNSAPSDAESFVCCSHVPVSGHQTKTYAAPTSKKNVLTLNGAPTTTVAQLIATDVPNASSTPPPEAKSSACCDQLSVGGSRTKTYAAPSTLASNGSFEWSGAPMTALSPSIATDVPNSSLLAPSDARSFVVSVQMPVTGFLMKTYAEPAFAPPALSSNGAPTRIVLPLIATE